MLFLFLHKRYNLYRKCYRIRDPQEYVLHHIHYNLHHMHYHNCERLFRLLLCIAWSLLLHILHILVGILLGHCSLLGTILFLSFLPIRVCNLLSLEVSNNFLYYQFHSIGQLVCYNNSCCYDLLLDRQFGPICCQN